ncbi:hypothetical protein LCGC14_2031720 [marine sediment metagenome]|uniref:Uncharacterized protein n=1 Tax=marine sediment metagenome TaxID=412755 RepID=A0A0F9EUS0_9ZZZZ
MPPEPPEHFQLHARDATRRDRMIAWQNLIVSIIAHPVHWAEVLFGVKLWRLDGIPTQSQADFIESCFWNVRTVVPSGHETGKTEACKVLVPLWLLSHPKSFFGLTAASWTAVAPASEMW